MENVAKRLLQPSGITLRPKFHRGASLNGKRKTRRQDRRGDSQVLAEKTGAAILLAMIGASYRIPVLVEIDDGRAIMRADNDAGERARVCDRR